MHIKFRDILILGFAFFATYFGAGNLIFPPQLGLQSGSAVLAGISGLTLSGIFLPILRSSSSASTEMSTPLRITSVNIPIRFFSQHSW